MSRLARYLWFVFELAIISSLICATRCSNYGDVFVGGNIYFTDADCYARMTRVRLCAQHPGRILRHHDFENFPRGTSPHTTAPFDYLILGLSFGLKPFAIRAIDLAGALISPLLAMAGGWLLWWWSRRMKFRYRWALLILYASSPILAHGTRLGRPDHQSLLIVLVMIAICAEWIMRCGDAETTATTLKRWSVVSGIAWGLAIWVSAYEPLILFLLLLLLAFLQGRHLVFANHRRIGWICFASIIAIALLVERRVPSLLVFQEDHFFKRWARTIGELQPVSPLNPVWPSWAGYMILVAPLLIWLAFRKENADQTKVHFERPPIFIPGLLVATYCLTIWQARWGYFFLVIFAITLPALLQPIKSKTAVWMAFGLSLLPILRAWDGEIWPNESEASRRSEARNESVQLRDLAINLQSSQLNPFLAPWWLSPAITYWSGQPGVAGSSHEALEGIVDTARFFLATDSEEPGRILPRHRVEWVVAYDSDRVALNSEAVLGTPVGPHPFCAVLDRTPTQVPGYLALFSQNGAVKLFQVVNNR